MAALVFFLAALVGGLSYFSHNSAFMITAVRIEGATATDREALERSAQTILSGNYYWFFPKRNFFLYPKEALQKSLLNSFKSLETVNIRTPDFKTLVISVTERTPHALWCGAVSGDEAGANGSPCYFLDERGLLFAEAPSFSGDLYLVYHSTIGKEEPIGSVVLPPDRFREVNVFLTSLRTLGLSPVAVDIDSLDLSIRLKKGGTILVSLNDDFSRTLQNLQSFLAGNASSSLSAGQGGEPFRSIDLRFGNKIFFKRR